jgi:hypothetical protein
MMKIYLKVTYVKSSPVPAGPGSRVRDIKGSIIFIYNFVLRVTHIFFAVKYLRIQPRQLR